MPIDQQLLEQLCRLAEEAGRATLPFWRQATEVMHKADDSPLTQADLAANNIILQGLAQLTPHIPVISEEACAIGLEQRQQWQHWWLVDPLDGTKEFIAGSDEFTVNLALIEQGRVLFGLVGVPAQGLLYYGGADIGAWCVRAGQAEPVHTAQAGQPLRVLASKRHGSAEQERLLDRLRAQMPVELVNAGSSLKFCWLAQGRADFYPRLAPTSQWDTAAGQAVLEGAGGIVVTASGAPMRYQAASSYLNPYFHAATRQLLQQELAWLFD